MYADIRLKVLVMRSTLSVTLIFLLALTPITSAASTIRVPADEPTVQSGIDAALDGDLVLVAPGLYSEVIDFSGKDIVLRSEEGAGVTILDGSFSWTVVTFAGGETEEAVINGFTIQYGKENFGGGIYCLSSSPTITNCVIFTNLADPSSGGGIYCSGTPSPLITDCTILDNIAGLHGGGIYCSSGSTARIERCIVSGNNADHGGGVYSRASSPSITNCIIKGNSADRYGGGIRSFDSPSPVITNCTVSQNSAGLKGGGFASLSHGHATITNCIFWGSWAIEGDEISIRDFSILTVSFSDILGGETGAYVESGSTLTWLAGNFESNPLFVGGTDYHLREGSPCIDAGTDAGVNTDIDGEQRPQGAGFDMGADEYIGDCWDDDDDGYFDSACGGSDCDDSDPEVNPGAAEGPPDDGTCFDGRDNDCDGLADLDDPSCVSGPTTTSTTSVEPTTTTVSTTSTSTSTTTTTTDPLCWDHDGDGYQDQACGGTDCDDSDPLVNPGAPEICDNGIDDDCDVLRDAWDPDCCDDADGDMFTDEECGGADCDDSDPLANPGMKEIQGDGIDNDCDGLIDEACFIGVMKNE